MAGVKELKQRLRSTASISKVTQSMKMIAVGKMKKSQTNMINARPYSSAIRTVMQSLVYGSESRESSFFEKRESDRTLYVLVTSDRGMCGGFNNNIFKVFNQHFSQAKGDSVITVGSKVCSYVTKKGVEPVLELRNAFTSLTFALAVDIGNALVNHYKSNKTDRVILVYNRFESAISQVVVREQLLPVELEKNADEAPKAAAMLTTEPSQDELFDLVFPRYINFLVWRALLESFASENAARMTTMDSATENAHEMIANFTLEINKLRQASITREISEIVGGSSALEQ